jgi:hypothetical protein
MPSPGQYLREAGWFVDMPGQMGMPVERITGAMEIPFPYLVGFVRDPFL